MLHLEQCYSSHPIPLVPNTTAIRQLSVLFDTHHAAAMSYMLPHLRSGWAVDQAILNEVRASFHARVLSTDSGTTLGDFN